MAHWMKTFALSVTALAVICAHAGAAGAAVSVTGVSFDGDTWIDPTEPVRITFDRMPDPAEGRIAVFVNNTDLTSQFRRKGNDLVYDPAVVKLPSGEKELVVQLVKGPDDWEEIGRFPIRVLTKAGFERLDVTPRIDANLRSTTNADHQGDTAPTGKIPDTEADFNTGLATDFKRKDAEIETEFNFLGVTLQEDALQYGEMGHDAYRFDLSDYLVTLRKGGAELQAGHIIYGDQPYLLDQFYSRGIMFNYNFRDKLFFSLASMSGSSIVGYRNFIGLQDRDHNITAGSIGVQIIDKERISSRFDTTLLVGQIEPTRNFNVGETPDKEESRGIGFRLRTNALDDRVTTDLNFARSTYKNPMDSAMIRGATVVRSRQTTNNAYSGDVAIELLRDQELWKDRTASLTTSYRHEMIDAEYQSLGVFSDADKLLNEVTIDAEVAGISAQYMHTWIEDNVDDVPTILKTKTRDTRFNVSAAIGELWDGPGSGKPWWPTVSYGINRVHQYGTNMPVMSGFTAGNFAGTGLAGAFASPAIVIPAGDIPDLVSTLQNVLVSFTGDRWSGEYTYSHAYENNRQPSLSRADFLTVTHGLSGSVQPIDDLWINAGYDKTRFKDKMTTVNSYTRSYNLGFDWDFLTDWNALGNYTTTADSDGAGGTKSRDIALETEVAYKFEVPSVRGKKLPGRVYVRHFWQSSETTEPLLFASGILPPDRTQGGHLWTLTGGMSISFF